VTLVLVIENASALAASRVAIAFWLILASAQWIVAAPVFANDGPMPWRRMATRDSSVWLARVRRRMAVSGFRLWMAVQLTIAVALVLAGQIEWQIVCLILLTVSQIGFVLVIGQYGVSGAEKMGMIALVGTSIMSIGVWTGDAALALAGCLIAGGQLVLCYTVAGLSKISQQNWRNGSELAGVMAHELWGHPLAAALLRSRTGAFLASWIVILAEALFPLALFAPQPWLLAALGAMLLFHFSTALIMRLNMFPWAFVTAYPAVLLLGDFVRSWIT
jgi:Vitamin K-dependent gamma-carboxylase